jgi:hypothetical protein
MYGDFIIVKSLIRMVGGSGSCIPPAPEPIPPLERKNERGKKRKRNGGEYARSLDPTAHGASSSFQGKWKSSLHKACICGEEWCPELTRRFYKVDVKRGSYMWWPQPAAPKERSSASVVMKKEWRECLVRHLPKKEISNLKTHLETSASKGKHFISRIHMNPLVTHRWEGGGGQGSFP